MARCKRRARKPKKNTRVIILKKPQLLLLNRAHLLPTKLRLQRNRTHPRLPAQRPPRPTRREWQAWGHPQELDRPQELDHPAGLPEWLAWAR